MGQGWTCSQGEDVVCCLLQEGAIRELMLRGAEMVWAAQSLVKAKEKQWGSLLQGVGWQWGAACEVLLGPRAAQCLQQGQHRAGHSSSAPAAGGVSAGPGQHQEHTRRLEQPWQHLLGTRSGSSPWVLLSLRCTHRCG